MAIISVFLAAWSCYLLQFWSRNLVFALVAIGCSLTFVALLLWRQTKCRLWIVPTVAVNALMLPSIVQFHVDLNGVVSDYLICAIIMALTIIASIIDVIPTQRKRPAT